MGAAFVLAVALGLPAAEAGELRLENVRPTHCVQGPARASDKVLPGDTYVLSFDIVGIAIDDAGKARFSVGVDVSDADGKPLFKQEPKEQEARASLGGDRLPAYAQLTVGLEARPGAYHAKVTVTDLTTKRTATLERTAQVLPKDFGIVRLTTSSDPEGRYPLSTPGSGDWLWVHCGIVGFTRGASKQPDVTLALRILDDQGNAVTAKPLTAQVNKDVPETAPALPLRQLLSLNRPGKFTVELTAADKVANKTATLSFPLTVAAPR